MILITWSSSNTLLDYFICKIALKYYTQLPEISQANIRNQCSNSETFVQHGTIVRKIEMFL